MNTPLKEKFSGTLVVIDDDPDDLHMIDEILQELEVKDQVRMFDQPKVALEYIRHTPEKLFMIVCDINMPAMTGLQLRQALIDDDLLRRKSVPFVFLSTSAPEEQVDDAFALYAHGYFVKPRSFAESQQLFENLFTYWRQSEKPVW